MLAHTQLKFKTAELQQEEVLQDLPKAIRAGIAQHLFHNVIEKTYLFKGVSDDFISQLVMLFFFSLNYRVLPYFTMSVKNCFKMHRLINIM